MAAGGAGLQKREVGTLERRMRRALRLGLEPIDARALAAVALVRLLIMPLASIALVRGEKLTRPCARRKPEAPPFQPPTCTVLMLLGACR